MMVEEARLRCQRFLGFGEVERVPEGVRQGVENHQSGIYARPQQRAMKVHGATQAR